MSTENSKDFMELLQEELDSRINEIESPGYEHVPSLTKGDYVGMISAAIVCVVIIVIGIV
ncbi:MAG: hypothetical protein GX567_11985 [Clostridia bacterium]|jgi:hypothetical protein|nr:hypothetical protein [Clostridia bacterium]